MSPLSLAAMDESEWFPIPSNARFAGFTVSTGAHVSLANPDSEFDIRY